MYRCISTLKGLIIDVESFSECSIEDWKEINDRFKCVFVVIDEEKMHLYRTEYGKNSVYKMEPFLKVFAPNPTTHKNILDFMKMKATEVAYVSRDRSFLDNAMSFLGGTIWVADKVAYEDGGNAPDFICKGFREFKRLVLKGIKGFLGEVVIYPDDERQGMVIPVPFEVGNEKYTLYMMGRYFGYSHYMSQLHPYSSALYLNKQENGKAYGKYNQEFSDLYICAIKRIQLAGKVDGVLSVPTRPGKNERFTPILEEIAEKCCVDNLSSNFKCVYDYPTQKSLSAEERQKNISDVFSYSGDLTGKNIVLIDDIITTGATIRECISVLKKNGAKKISIIVLGINQFQRSYWSSEVVNVSCDRCGERMRLFINSGSKNFFYSCSNCKATTDFFSGRSLLYEKVNSEMEYQERSDSD